MRKQSYKIPQLKIVLLILLIYSYTNNISGASSTKSTSNFSRNSLVISGIHNEQIIASNLFVVVSYFTLNYQQVEDDLILLNNASMVLCYYNHYTEINPDDIDIHKQVLELIWDKLQNTSTCVYINDIELLNIFSADILNTPPHKLQFNNIIDLFKSQLKGELEYEHLGIPIKIYLGHLVYLKEIFKTKLSKQEQIIRNSFDVIQQNSTVYNDYTKQEEEQSSTKSKKKQ